MANAAVSPKGLPFAELTKQVLGEPLSMVEVWDRLGPADEEGEQPSEPRAELAWVGSVGYERHRNNRDFARALAEAGVERLVDVRELPISRRRGFAKTALANAFAEVDVEYVHLKALGNPKPFRDLYKSGRADEGRRRYKAFLLKERRDALSDLAELLASKKTALMCVEHDEVSCHRAVILEALREELGLRLRVSSIE